MPFQSFAFIPSSYIKTWSIHWLVSACQTMFSTKTFSTNPNVAVDWTSSPKCSPDCSQMISPRAWGGANQYVIVMAKVSQNWVTNFTQNPNNRWSRFLLCSRTYCVVVDCGGGGVVVEWRWGGGWGGSDKEDMTSGVPRSSVQGFICYLIYIKENPYSCTIS